VRALIASQLHERRRSILAWGLSIGLMSAFIVAIYPSVESALGKLVHSYPNALKQAFGVGELSSAAQYLHAEMLSLIVPLAVGYLAVRAMASALSGAAESGRLDVLLSAPASRARIVTGGFLATAAEVACVLLISLALSMLGSLLAGAGLPFDAAAAGFANVWPLAMLAAALGILVTWRSLHTSVVTGVVAGVLVFMYVIDLVGRLDTSLDGVRYVSVFRYYGKAAVDGFDVGAFLGVSAVALALAAVGSWLFGKRDL
jgi:ABC-2 type transport system permease protein